MDKKATSVSGLSKAGPYSHVVEAAGFLFLSGAIPLVPATGQVIKDDIPAATAQAFENAKAVLAAVGSSLDRVVKTTVFLRDMADFPAMNETYARFFPSDPPARSTVAVKELPAGAPVEIEMIAVR